MIHSDQEGCRTFCKPTRKRRLPRGDLSAKKIQRRYTSRFHGLRIFCLTSRFKCPLDHFRPANGGNAETLCSARIEQKRTEGLLLDGMWQPSGPKGLPPVEGD